MELDDLKKTWNAQPSVSQEDDRDLIRQLIRRSHSGLSRLVRWELAIGLLTLLFLLGMMVVFHSRMSAFYFKLSVPLFAYAIPIYYRLYRSVRFLRQMDFAGDIRSTLTQFLTYYTRTLRFYQWGAYAAIALVTVLIFTDAKFVEMTWTIKGLVLGYMAIISLLVGPFVRRFYGSKARVIREYLDERE